VDQLEVLAILIDVPLPSVPNGSVSVLLAPLPALICQGVAFLSVEQSPFVPLSQLPPVD
jgi:hypothetical protein